MASPFGLGQGSIYDSAPKGETGGKARKWAGGWRDGERAEKEN